MSLDMELVGDGLRHRLTIAGEPYYLIVDMGQEGPHISITCPRENAPENLQMRLLLERICTTATEMLQHVCKQDASLQAAQPCLACGAPGGADQIRALPQVRVAPDHRVQA